MDPNIERAIQCGKSVRELAHNKNRSSIVHLHLVHLFGVLLFCFWRHSTFFVSGNMVEQQSLTSRGEREKREREREREKESYRLWLLRVGDGGL
jgi:hypothetical protein